MYAPYPNTRKDRPVSVMPIAIFVGVEGSLPRLDKNPQNATSGNVRIRIQIALIELESVPETAQSVLSSAKYVIVEPFWWKTIQKTITIRKITIRAMIRLLSETVFIRSEARLDAAFWSSLRVS